MQFSAYSANSLRSLRLKAFCQGNAGCSRIGVAGYNPNSSRSLFVCARLTGISVCFLSSIRN